MTSWKTTSSGILSVVGGIVGLVFAYKNKALNEASVMGSAAAILTGFGLMFARDYDKSSEDHGIDPVKQTDKPTTT